MAIERCAELGNLFFYRLGKLSAIHIDLLARKHLRTRYQLNELGVKPLHCDLGGCVKSYFQPC